MVWEI
jgi:hypothetical protein